MNIIIPPIIIIIVPFNLINQGLESDYPISFVLRPRSLAPTPLHPTVCSVALVMDRNFSDALRNIEQAMSVEKPTADLLCLRGKVQWALDLMEAGNRDFRSAQEVSCYRWNVYVVGNVNCN